MLKILFVCFIVFSADAYSQSDKPDPNSSINAQEQINGLPGGAAGAYSIRAKKKTTKSPDKIAPVKNTNAANCASTIGEGGFTACEAGKKTR